MQNPKAITSFDGPHRYLSNFSHLDVWVIYNGILFPTVEHAFQAAKSIDPAVQETFARLPHPNAAKVAGNSIELRPDWNEVKYDIMKNLVRQKFQNNPALMARLLKTAGRRLVEGNYWHDNTWGVCSCSHCQQQGAVGKNWLGQILMEVRNEEEERQGNKGAVGKSAEGPGKLAEEGQEG